MKGRTRMVRGMKARTREMTEAMEDIRARLNLSWSI